MKVFEIIKLNNGWYDFSNIPQNNNYIKVECLRFSSDKHALKVAKTINRNLTFLIKRG
tara:strand:- start:338 stop:511 length:174 start_codon:yes stop_codon:yes gene_type:complete